MFSVAPQLGHPRQPWYRLFLEFSICFGFSIGNADVVKGGSVGMVYPRSRGRVRDAREEHPLQLSYSSVDPRRGEIVRDTPLRQGRLC